MPVKKIVKPSYTKEDAINTIERNISWINSVDNKASILLGVFGLIFGGSISLVTVDFVQSMIENENLLVKIHGIAIAITVLVMLFSVLVMPILLFLTIFARTSSSDYKPEKNVIYFKDIINIKYNDFQKSVREINEEEIFEDLVSQVYITSKIATLKYKFLNFSYICFISYFVSAFLYVLLINLIN